jgi:alkanesulfonate monooxygenase SsuD/methylene tetrahydromethanopterin reductase-like flavin-dependent oxidoreductase (luciferase family)
MRLSISITNYSWRDQPLAAGLTQLAEAAEAGGLDTLWVPDHVAQVNPTVPPGDDEMLEAYAVLAYLAARTTRIRLGTLVTNAVLRPPALLMAAVATLDALSNGRAWLGIGAGYGGAEIDDLGLPPVPAKERFERFEETILAVRQALAGDQAPFIGHHLQMHRPRLSPRPARAVPLLVGGTGEQRTLRLVAEHADACNLFDLPDDGTTVRHKLSVLAGHCADQGRPYDGIEKTLSTRLGPNESAPELTRRCARTAGWGIDHMIFVSSHPWPAEDLRVITEAAPAVADL